jgi:predicted metal-binding protein
MAESDLDKYCAQGLACGASHAQLIHPSTVVTAPWVRLKCQFGCPGYNRGYCCPPHTPTAAETRTILDSYNRAILFHRESPYEPARGKTPHPYIEKLIKLETEMFKDGYYKAFVLTAGPCHACEVCAKNQGDPCKFGWTARPSMESCGIDVYQTARANGFTINTLREMTETQNWFCLMLVD